MSAPTVTVAPGPPTQIRRDTRPRLEPAVDACCAHGAPGPRPPTAPRLRRRTCRARPPRSAARRPLPLGPARAGAPGTPVEPAVADADRPPVATAPTRRHAGRSRSDDGRRAAGRPRRPGDRRSSRRAGEPRRARRQPSTAATPCGVGRTRPTHPATIAPAVRRRVRRGARRPPAGRPPAGRHRARPTSSPVTDQLVGRTQPAPTSGRPGSHGDRAAAGAAAGLRMCEPRDGVVEVAAVLGYGTQTWAMAAIRAWSGRADVVARATLVQVRLGWHVASGAPARRHVRPMRAGRAVRRREGPSVGVRTSQAAPGAPWQRLYFLPEPQ